MLDQIAKAVAGSLCSSTSQQILYLWNYDSNVKKLEEKVKDLESKEGAVKLQVDVAKRDAEIIRPDVSNWFAKVGKMKKEADELLKRRESVQMGCLFVECPNLYPCYKLSKEASDMTTELSNLENAGNFVRVGYPAPPGQTPFTSPTEFESFESQTRIMNDVSQALKDDSVTRIGICGMGGVGKTTLVYKIADEVKDKKLFDEVAPAIVSKDLDLEKVQNQLAGCLGLSLGENTTGHVRRERLYTRLTMDRDKRVLIILDDLWQEIDLHNIGIPEREGLKVLFTSRLTEVCSDMSAKLFNAEVLSEEEAWNLFKKRAEISEEEIEGIAQEVAMECGGLPLAIMTVGKALNKTKGEYAWRVALQQLKEASAGTSIRGMENKVYSRIKWSYDYLENVHSKKLLLLCSLFPEDYDISVEELVMHAKGLQLFQDVETMARATNRVCTIIDELKNCYLLLESKYQGRVKLHDVVRDVCLSIASSGEHVYMVKHFGLEEWPQIDCRHYTCISLTFQAHIRLPSRLECPNLKLLRMIFQQGQPWVEEPRVDMPEDFFEKMKELKVLELTNLNSKVPSSLQLLENLRTLLFIECKLSGDVSVIKSLNKLEILSFHSSCLESLPVYIMELTNLESLDLRLRKGPPIPLDFLVSLKRLEQLYWGDHDSKHLVDANKIVSREGGGVFLELEKLVIERAYKMEHLWHGNLPHGSFARLREVQLYRLWELRNLWGAIRPPCLGNLSILEIRRCHSLKNLFLKSFLKCFGQLQQIIIQRCRELEVIVLDDEEHRIGGLAEFPKLRRLRLDSLEIFKGFGPDLGALFIKVVLANLEILKIENVKGIRWIVDDQMPIGALSKLRDMEVGSCHDLLHVAANDAIKLLQSLKQLLVDSCNSLQVIFDFGGLNVEAADVQTPLDSLQFLKLKSLHSLNHIWRMLQEGRIHAFKNLRELSVDDCDNLIYLLSPSTAKMLVGLEILYISGCDRMEAIIGMEERAIPEIEHEKDIVEKNEDGEEATNRIDFPKLRRLAVKWLRNIITLCSNVEKNEDGEETANKIEFPNLRRLVVSGLPNLRMLCSENVDLKLPSLIELVIDECPMMTKLCVGHLIATRLTTVQLDSKDEEKKVSLDEFNSWLQDCELKIRCIYCSQMKREECSHLI